MVFRDASAMADDRFELRLAQESNAIRQEIAALRAEMATHGDVEIFRREMAAGFSRVERQVADSRVDMIKWSFLFWTGQCFVIVGFLLVFLRNQ
jgi:hypothetical protein